jgi:hypothetical protein
MGRDVKWALNLGETPEISALPYATTSLRSRGIVVSCDLAYPLRFSLSH